MTQPQRRYTDIRLINQDIPTAPESSGNPQPELEPRWEIQEYSLCDGAINAWTDSYVNGDLIPVTFATEQEAREELSEYLVERPDYSEDEFSVVSLDEHQCGEIAKITRDGDNDRVLFPCGGILVPCEQPAVVVQPLWGDRQGQAVYACVKHSSWLESRPPCGWCRT